MRFVTFEKENRLEPGVLADGRVTGIRGAGFDDAFEAATGESVGGFARSYFRRETFWTTWVPVVTSSTVLWMAITVLALLAIKRRRERDALLREGWALEERARITGDVSQNPKDDPAQWN